MNNAKSDICESRENIALVQFKLVIMNTNDAINGLYKSALSTNVLISSLQGYFSFLYMLIIEGLEALFIVYKHDQNSS